MTDKTYAETVLAKTVGYVPEDVCVTREGDRIIGTAKPTHNANVELGDETLAFVIDQATRTMAISLNGGTPDLVHPIDGPDRMTLRMAVRIIDEEEWDDREIKSGIEAMSLLFGGQPEAESCLKWDDIRITRKEDLALIELDAASTDRMATAAYVRRLRGDLGYVPVNLREAVFEIGVGSSEAPCPSDLGYEIIGTQCWPGFFEDFPQASAALRLASGDKAPSIHVLDELIEGDIALAYAPSEPGLFRHRLASVDAEGREFLIDRRDLQAVMPDAADATPSL